MGNQEKLNVWVNEKAAQLNGSINANARACLVEINMLREAQQMSQFKPEIYLKERIENLYAITVANEDAETEQMAEKFDAAVNRIELLHQIKELIA